MAPSTSTRSTVVICAVLLLVWLSCGPAAADTTVHARLQQVNHSGVHGTATVTARQDGGLTVTLHASGLVPGQPHAQHLHGTVGDRHFMCPTMGADTDGDGLLTNEEASGEYGNIFLALTTRGDTSVRSGLDSRRMPVADADGRVDYRRTFTPEELPAGLVDRLSNLHLVVHGIDVNGNGRYDLAGAGVSTFAKNLGLSGVPEEVTDPAACGMVTGAGSAVTPQGGVETGGGPGGATRPLLGLLGGLLVAGSLAVLLARTPGRWSWARRG